MTTIVIRTRAINATDWGLIPTQMMIMPSNNTKGLVHYIAGAYPGRIGLLCSPDGWTRPFDYLPYALDNGCFTGFDAEAFSIMLHKASRCTHQPVWVVVPDVVADRDGTLALWREWAGIIADMGFKLAIVAQDGMTPDDIPAQAFCCFIGGTTGWKLENAHKFKSAVPWLHIGRVNTRKRLRWAESIGANSVDGTGFFRGRRQQQDMMDFISGGIQYGF